MKILGHVPFAWPQQRGGSEVALHRTLAWMAAQGHEVRCLIERHRGSPTDGVLYARRDSRGVRDWWEWADVAISQHTTSPTAAILGVETGTPVAHFTHNWHALDSYPDLPADNLLIWNTQAAADALGSRWPGRSVVVHPPVFPDDYETSGGDLVTQVNLSNIKGGPLFWEVAAAMPGAEFLAVIGGWGYQVSAAGDEYHPDEARAPLMASAPPNVTVTPTTTDVAGDILERTRVLMMPTGRVSDLQAGESYGLIAAEAVCAGIPVLATRSPGTEEALGDAGIWCNPTDPAEWRHQLKRLADPGEWTEAHMRCMDRAKALDPTSDLEGLQAALSALAVGVSV